MQGPLEPGGPSAPEPASGQLPGPAPAGTASGGAGLSDHAAADPFPRSAGLISGVVALSVTVLVAVTFYFLNPAFSAGRAGGAPDQLGPRPVASPSVSPAAFGSPSVSASPAAFGSPSPLASPAAFGSPSPSASPGAFGSPSPLASPAPSPASR